MNVIYRGLAISIACLAFTGCMSKQDTTALKELSYINCATNATELAEAYELASKLSHSSVNADGSFSSDPNEKKRSLSCTQRLLIDSDDDKYGFNVSDGESKYLQNPDDGYANIYFYRKPIYAGRWIDYWVHSKSSSEIINDDNFTASNIENIKNVFFRSRSNSIGLKKINASDGKYASIYARTESTAILNIAIKSGKIYCVNSPVTMGWMLGKPIFVPSTKDECIAAIDTILTNNDNLIYLLQERSMQEIQTFFNDKQNRIVKE